MTEKQIKLGGKNYTLAALTVGDLKAIQKRAKDNKRKYIAEHKDEVLADAKKLGEIEPLKLLEYLHKPISDEEVDEMMSSFEGISYMAYLSLQHNYSELTESQVSSMVTMNDFEALSEFFGGEEKQGIFVDMKTLGRNVVLEGGKSVTISELIFETQKKKRRKKTK